MANSEILIVRIGSMGDVIHALPAVATLKHSFPGSSLCWVIHPRWAPLLEGNPFVDEVITMDRRSLPSVRGAWRRLRSGRFAFAVDFQGLVQSALVASVGRPDRIYGFHQAQVREKAAALFYSKRIRVNSAHVVDRNLELAVAAGASSILKCFPLPDGAPEGDLPEDDFVLANPLAGWCSKQWPMRFYDVLALRLRDELGLTLVLNAPPDSRPLFSGVRAARTHFSGLPGLIYAARRAVAVVGIDSGPMHLAAALAKPGIAIFGPTDPARNGPYGDSISVLRSAEAVTSYKRGADTDRAMLEITPDLVFDKLKACIRTDKSARHSA